MNQKHKKCFIEKIIDEHLYNNIIHEVTEQKFNRTEIGIEKHI